MTENFLETCLFFNANTLSRYLLKLAEKQFKHLNLSPAHASMMLMVYDSPGISPKKLCSMLNLSASTITRFIDSLEKKELVKRKSNGKSVSVYPTSKGLDLKKPVAMAYKRLYLSYTSILGQDFSRHLSSCILEAARKLDKHI
jgi:DNA-binding MarR family transcriptional regulator